MHCDLKPSSLMPITAPIKGCWGDSYIFVKSLVPT